MKMMLDDFLGMMRGLEDVAIYIPSTDSDAEGKTIYGDWHYCLEKIKGKKIAVELAHCDSPLGCEITCEPFDFPDDEGISEVAVRCLMPDYMCETLDYHAKKNGLSSGEEFAAKIIKDWIMENKEEF